MSKLELLKLVPGPLNAQQATAAGCATCGWTWDHDPMSGEPGETDGCPQCQSFDCDYLYVEGAACANCGKLASRHPIDHRWCSRVCKLQGEYAEALKARA